MNDDNISLHDIIYDPGSTTKAFKLFSSDYSLDILFSGFADELFKRIVVIKLDSIPVMVASSTTKPTDLLFLDILQNSATRPIGVRLFGDDSGISRGEMIVNKTTTAYVTDPIVLEYLEHIVPNGELYFRQSIFSYEDEQMRLDEYVLPGLEYIIDKYNNIK